MNWLREQIEFLNNPVASILFWLILVGIVYVVFTYVIQKLAQKSDNEWDDIVFGILRKPVLLIVSAYGILDIIQIFTEWDVLIASVRKLFSAIAIIVIAWLLYKLIKDLIGDYFKGRADETEGQLDDVLIPIIEKAGPIIVIIVATIALISIFRPEFLQELLTVLGALSFLLIFLFQEPLSNLFSGVYLWIDTPFKLGDLIFLEDGERYRVEEIGSRVTRLYNTERHIISNVPNNNLAAQTLINITKPTVELRFGIDIGIAYSTTVEDVEIVKQLLNDIANAHPHVLYPWYMKKELIEEQLANDDDLSLQSEFIRLKHENMLREANQKIWFGLKNLINKVHEFERGGFDSEEQSKIKPEIEEIKRQVDTMRYRLTVWLWCNQLLQIRYKVYNAPTATLAVRYKEYNAPAATLAVMKKIEDLIINPADADDWAKWTDVIARAYETEKGKPSRDRQLIKDLKTLKRIPLIGTLSSSEERFQEVMSFGDLLGKDWSYFYSAQVNPTVFQDFERGYKNWQREILNLMNKLEESVDAKWQGAYAVKLDSFLEDMTASFEDKFPLHIPGWQHPDADFVGFGESSLDFRLEFFVDDLIGDHYERLGDVFDDIGIQIKAKFDVKKIEIPFPQKDVWFRNSMPKG